MRALSQDEMQQVSGGWSCWGWSSWSFKSYSYCEPKTTYTCEPKTTDSCYTSTSCEPKPTCPVEEVPL